MKVRSMFLVLTLFAVMALSFVVAAPSGTKVVAASPPPAACYENSEEGAAAPQLATMAVIVKTSLAAPVTTTKVDCWEVLDVCQQAGQSIYNTCVASGQSPTQCTK